MTPIIALGRFAIAAIALAFLTAGEAGAKGIAVINWGETVSHLGDVSPQKRDELKVGKVGYKYSYFGVFWIDFWRSGGTYCVYEGDKYGPIEPAAAAYLLDKTEDELGRPFFYLVPPGWLVVGPLIAFWIVSAVQDKRRAAAFARLFQDPEYKKALQILNDEYAKQPAEGTEEQPAASQEERYRTALAAGVEHLAGTGIERKEAEWNLETMIRALDHAAENPEGGVPGYRIACECGATLAVTAGMAGSTATCPCGRAVTVPSLNELKSM